MIKNLVFHIGDPKNGSSSIQRALQTRAWKCDSISVAPQKELNASALANSLIPARSPKKYEAQFTRKKKWVEKTDADLGIISAEFFSGAEPEALLAALQEFMPAQADGARIIAYVRPHAGRALSGYAQRVKTGAFKGTLTRFVKTLEGRTILNYHARFDKWQSVFGDRFTLRPFIREQMRDGDVTADFFHEALQGAEFTLRSPEKTNESLSLAEIAAMRVVQTQWMEADVPKFLRLSLGAAIGRELGGFDGRSKTKLQLDRVNAARIRELYREDAAQLDAQFFDEPLMERALIQAVEEAVPEVQSLEATDYFNPATIDEMGRIAGEITTLVKDMPHAWRQDYHVKKGQVTGEDIKKISRKRQKNATEVWGLLQQMAQAMAKGA